MTDCRPVTAHRGPTSSSRCAFSLSPFSRPLVFLQMEMTRGLARVRNYSTCRHSGVARNTPAGSIAFGNFPLIRGLYHLGSAAMGDGGGLIVIVYYAPPPRRGH